MHKDVMTLVIMHINYGHLVQFQSYKSNIFSLFSYMFSTKRNCIYLIKLPQDLDKPFNNVYKIIINIFEKISYKIS